MPAELSTIPRILVAEDERVMSDVIRFNLQRAGYEVTVARNGLDAWDHLQSRAFDLILSDYQMPGLTGVELCRRLRTAFAGWDVPFILLSARGLELNAACLHDELKILTVLFKPFSPRELLQMVANALSNSALLVPEVTR